MPVSSLIFRRAALACVFVLLGMGAGCQLLQTAADIPGQTLRAVTSDPKANAAADPVEVQQRLVRFADEFSAGMITGVGKLRRGTNAIGHAEELKLRIMFGTQAATIASGPNALANLLDMTVFVTVTRSTVERHWRPTVYGESAQPLLESCIHFETQIWEFVGTVLKPAQQEELREAIAGWQQSQPSFETPIGARAVGFTSEVAKRHGTATRESSVFALLRLDPLAGLDPATREIAQTRLFAERALFVAQWMPTLLRWQTELLSLNTMAMPEVQQLVANTTQLAASAERFARVAEQLPDQVSRERGEILKALESQEKNLTPLVNEVRQTLATGTQMSTSLNTTLTTFDTLMQRFGVGETNNTPPAAVADGEPFRILDYAQTATQLEAAARQLTELVRTLDQTLASTNLARLSAQVAPVVAQAQTSGKEIVDHAFWKAVLLLVVACTLVLLTVLLNRVLRFRHINARNISP